ncbi:MAG: nicotinate-nucleotide adenylyltransferase [Pseudomonadota bacterium]
MFKEDGSKKPTPDNPTAPLGVIHGRFQILHNDHLEYLLAGKARCNHLVVGITNPDPSLTRDDPADSPRSRLSANPLTYFERYLMVGAVLSEAGVSRDDFSVVPFPINVPDLYHHYVPMDAVFFITICDAWGERKLELLESRGLRVDVMWRRTPSTKGLTGSNIRGLMIAGKQWDHLVPKSAASLIRTWGIEERLKRTAGV